ncbi:UbiX family flavin prenyltransferase [Adlercreutzia sp. ZJ304]|uniref:UbiX family flavin prenyltransferase n=1 Tax=Adlercreutzia sp. ZJ304 TaxID=2709791 RepID=UPI0013ED90B9|nr:UbiX family flavin prenyltransferase [Adlercreutzia sp. ZJ304]
MRIIVGISGASCAILGIETLKSLGELGVETHLIISKGAQKTIESETNYSVSDVCALADHNYEDGDLGALVSSGSFRTDGMIVAPCSMKSASAIAHAYDANLLVRAADVCLKENRRVVLMPREMPLNKAQLRNLLECAECGCTILPPMLTFYNKPSTLEEQVHHIVGKALMQFGLDSNKFKPWDGNL